MAQPREGTSNAEENLASTSGANFFQETDFSKMVLTRGLPDGIKQRKRPKKNIHVESANERRKRHAKTQLEEDWAFADYLMDGVRLSGPTIPPHIKDFLNKSIEEYKRLTLSSEIAKTLFLKKIKEKEEGMFPT